MATIDSQTDTSLKDLMTEVVGSGPKSADDMTYEQARGAMDRITEGAFDPTTLGAFWLANRWKRNTPAELAGFLDALDDRVERAIPEADPVDCGANYDGKHTSALLGVASGLVSAAAGVPVVTHSGDRVPTQKADAYKHVLDELGVATDLAPADSARMVDETGFGFYYQPRFNPAVDSLSDRRDRMGVRTFCNTIETLCNPAGASVHLGSFYHLSFAKRVIDTLARSDSATVERVCMFQGMEGYDDIRPGYTKVAERDLAEASVTDYEIETAAYGMDFESDDLAVGDVAADSAGLTDSVLAGEQDGVFADAIALNAAMRIYAGGEVEHIEAGLDRAREALASGEAGARLDELRAFDPKESR
jgi:anthranilate phosphoribosyltransferase